MSHELEKMTDSLRDISETLKSIAIKMTVKQQAERTTSDELATIEAIEGKVRYMEQENERLRQKLGLVGTELEKERSEKKALEAQLALANQRLGQSEAKVKAHCPYPGNCLTCNPIRMDGVDMMPLGDGNAEAVKP